MREWEGHVVDLALKERKFTTRGNNSEQTIQRPLFLSLPISSFVLSLRQKRKKRKVLKAFWYFPCFCFSFQTRMFYVLLSPIPRRIFCSVSGDPQSRASFAVFDYVEEKIVLWLGCCTSLPLTLSPYCLIQCARSTKKSVQTNFL